MSLEAIAAYLKAAAASEQKTGAERREPQPFITVSREAGAGGGALAEMIVRRMRELEGREWRVLDRELCERVAAKPGLRVTMQSLAVESYRGGLEDSIARLILDESPQSAVAQATFRVVRAAAAAGRVVIVGRAGSLVARDLPLGVHLRIVMPRARRLAALQARFQLTRAEAERRCDELDRTRGALVKDCFARDIEDPLLYDAILNADRLSLATIADVAARLSLSRVTENP